MTVYTGPEEQSRVVHPYMGQFTLTIEIMTVTSRLELHQAVVRGEGGEGGHEKT